MNKLNKFFLYALTLCMITFSACKDDEVDPVVDEVEDPIVDEEEDEEDNDDEENEEDNDDQEEEEEEEESTIYVSDFEGLSFPEGDDVYYGQDKVGENLGEDDYGYTRYQTIFTSGQVNYTAIYNEIDADDNYYSGVTYSRLTDNRLEGLDGRDVAMPGQGAEDSEVYGIYNGSTPFTFEYEEGAIPQSIQLTNNAYAYSSMLKGDDYAKKFGGLVGDDPDFFKLTITGHDAEDNETGSVDFYLADYRFDDNSEDYIVDSWEEVDLTALGTVHKISFSFESSDEGEWGMNTPAYFAFDNLTTEAAPAAEGEGGE